MRRLATKSHRAQSTPLGLKCGPSVELLLQRSRVARPATGSNSPLNALEPSFVPKNKNLNFKFVNCYCCSKRANTDSGFAFSCSTCPPGWHLSLARQAVNRSIGMRQMIPDRSSHTDQTRLIDPGLERDTYLCIDGIKSNLRFEPQLACASLVSPSLLVFFSVSFFFPSSLILSNLKCFGAIELYEFVLCMGPK